MSGLDLSKGKANVSAAVPVPVVVSAVPVPVIELLESDSEESDWENAYENCPVIPSDQRLPIGTPLQKLLPNATSVNGRIEELVFGGRAYLVSFSNGDRETVGHAGVLKYRVGVTTSTHANASVVQLHEKEHIVKKRTRDALLPQELSSKDGNLNAQDNVRRSSRQRTSTVVMVDGYTVKKQNNYLVNAVSYQFSARGEEPAATATATAMDRKPYSRKNAPKAVTQKKKTTSPAEISRIAIRDQVQANILSKAACRQHFFLQHAATLAPFVDPAVLNRFHNSNLANSISTKLKPQFMQPDGITADLRDYQLAGLNWMAQMHQQNVGMILGDEMGLGKTIQTLALICHLKERYAAEGPSLVVCPLSVLYSWCTEAEKWAPGLKYKRFHCSDASGFDKILNEDLRQYDIIITTYEMVKSQHLTRLWSLQHFHLQVLDEGHRIKSADTQLYPAVCKIHAENRLILTGTPLANNLVELHSLLHFLVPDVFIDSKPFSEAFNLTLNVVDPIKLSQAHRLLKLFMLRRLKTEVEKLMPKKIETKVLCPLSNTQIWFYKALLIKDLKILSAAERLGSGKVLNNLVMQLRKCCIHPFLFDGVEDPKVPTTVESLVGASGKLAVLDKLLCSLYKKKHRVVLFSQFTRVLDILEDYCHLRGWKYCRFDGSTMRAKRNYIVNHFNAPDSDRFIFLMTTRSGGMGLNLQTADTCILFDSDWNPQPDIQAMARVHRIGQSKTVHVYRLVTEGTVEQRMVERAEKKLYLDRMVTRDGVAEDLKDEENNSGKLMETLRFGCDAVFGQGMKKMVLPSDSDIEMITDRSRSQDYTAGNLKGSADSSAKDFDATKEYAATTDFGGIDFKKIREQYEQKKGPKSLSDLTELWSKRQRKSRIKMVDGLGTGYGCASVPVLVSNDYELQKGEKSVYEVELDGRKKVPKLKSKSTYVHQDFCQVCKGDDGNILVLCPRCPVSVHLTWECAGLIDASQFKCCSQHHCAVCLKSPSEAGGLLFPCASACTKAFCEDHIPDSARILHDGCPRFEELSFEKKTNLVYIYCTTMCEKYAIRKLGWVPSSQKTRPRCPPALDVATCYGGEVDEIVDAPDESIIFGKRKRKPVRNSINEPSIPKSAFLSESGIEPVGHADDVSQKNPGDAQRSQTEACLVDLTEFPDSE